MTRGRMRTRLIWSEGWPGGRRREGCRSRSHVSRWRLGDPYFGVLRTSTIGADSRADKRQGGPQRAADARPNPTRPTVDSRRIAPNAHAAVMAEKPRSTAKATTECVATGKTASGAAKYAANSH